MPAWQGIRGIRDGEDYAPAMELSMGQRKAVTQKLAIAYRRGSRGEKSRIPSKLSDLTGRHRDHAGKAIRSAGAVRSTKATTPLPRTVNRAFNASDRPEGRGEQPAPRSRASRDEPTNRRSRAMSREQWGTGRVRARFDAWILVHPVARGSREDNGVHRCRVPGGSDPAGTRQETRWFRRPAQTTNDRATARPKS